MRRRVVSDDTERRLAEYFAGRESTIRESTRRWRTTDVLARHVTDILDDFRGSMSCRQIFYLLVSRGAVANSQPAYERVQRLLVQMRRDGDVEYGRIVDRNRAKHHRSGWRGVEDLMASVTKQYHRDLWAEQPVIPLIAVEKAALEGVIGEVVDEYGAQLWTLRGFASESFAYDWAQEVDELVEQDKRVVVHYFGDLDPSGLEIEQDAKDKLRHHGAEFEWHRAGLLFADLERFDLVTVPVKHKDSRARRYLNAFGDHAAELDALPPDELRRRVRHSIERHMNREQWDRLKQVEATERESLHLVAANWDRAVRGAKGVVA